MWRTGVPTFAKVQYKSVYNGVDLVYYGDQGRLEYDFVVAPGASARPIRLRFAQPNHLRLDAGGDLTVAAANGEITFRKPVVYQLEDGHRQPIAGQFKLMAGHTVGFQLGRYNHSEPLVIDPQLTYVTYLGGTGTGTDDGQAIAVDGVGSAYVTGYTTSTNFPVTAGAVQATTGSANAIAYVTKFSPDGSTLVYSTYIGGTGGDHGNSIAVDLTGNAYITGYTYSADFPVTTGAYQIANNAVGAGLSNVFVAKLNATGSALVYATYLGGAGNVDAVGGSSGDFGEGIAVDAAGDTYLTGYAYSTTFPVTGGAYQATNNAVGNGGQAVFVTKLNPTGSALIYSTYLGGTGSDADTSYSNGTGDAGAGIAIDAAGDAYVAGYSNSSNFPVTAGAFQPINNTTQNEFLCYNGFISKFNPTGTGLLYSSYIGGSGTVSGNGEICDAAFSVALDSAGSAYLGGLTQSSNFPVTAGAFQATNNEIGAGVATSFAAKVNAAGTALAYSTYLGGSGASENANGITVDALGDAFVVGTTSAATFPLTGTAYQATNTAGNEAAFLTEFNPAGAGLVYSTYLGGTGGNYGNGVAVDSGGNPYLTGRTTSVDFPVTEAAYQATNNTTGGTSFVARFGVGAALAPTPTTTTLALTAAAAPVTTVASGTVVTLTAAVAAIATPVFPGNSHLL